MSIEAKKKIKEETAKLPKRIRPKITDLEIDILQEYIKDRFGLKKKIPTHQLLISNFNTENLMHNSKELQPEINTEEGISFKPDRNLHFSEFNESLKNYQQDLIQRLENRSKFRRKDRMFEEAREFHQELTFLKKNKNHDLSVIGQNHIQIKNFNRYNNNMKENFTPISVLPKLNSSGSGSSLEMLKLINGNFPKQRNAKCRSDISL